MAQDMFLKIAGIDGESSDSAHKGEIEISHWEWDIKQNATMHSGSGGGAGKATISDLYFEHSADRSSPNLMKYCLTGKHISEAILVTRKAGGNPLEYMKITMNDVVVTGVHPICSGHSDGIREQVSLSFSKVTQEYKMQNSQGGSAGMVTASFDIKANRET
ncbi:type VI secretion system secreted protein Hcp [Collimonas sp. OK307]|uniref:Hcp family type VI secretion system effector n=1 Tax=Collimonas sp. OK307 TaxID=1801620 RepID=UPI0008E303C5|nr:type VI secretion system tube protein Hcp [Collimonas sp. OK307]SFI26544.1 type VI secretion system secreted protein Hcp [Collimonas sp. OK307]